MLLAGGLVVVLMGSQAVGQQPTYSVAIVPSQQQQIDMLQQEVAAMRAQMNALQNDRIEALPQAHYPVSKLDNVEPSPNSEGREKSDTPEPYRIGSELGMTAHWHHGLEVESKNKDFRVHVGGRTQVDTTWYSGDESIETPLVAGGVGPLQDSWNFRRGRLRVDGKMYEVIDFACEYDFINEAAVDAPVSLLPPQGNPVALPAPTDLWVQATHLPILGTVRVGNQKDPFGFEHLTSSRYLNFLERSFMQDAFVGPFNNGFSPGIQAFNTYWDERGTWAAGIYKNVNNIFANGFGDGEYETAGRITFLPWYQDEGRQLLHLGLAGTYKALDEEQIRFRSRGDLRSGAPGPQNPVFANTGNIIGDDETQYGLELAGISGPWSFQSEYISSSVYETFTVASPPGSAGFQAPPGTPLGTVTFDGFYVEVHYFLTGETRAYNRRTGVFDRVIPFENFFIVRDGSGCVCSGWGAWQVLARYQFLDLQDRGIDGGRLDAITFGLNWFLNPNLKVQWNYDWTHREFVNNLGAAGNGDIHGFGARVAFDF
jgi:phosphate-selective porin OprO/OprP